MGLLKHYIQGEIMIRIAICEDQVNQLELLKKYINDILQDSTNEILT